MTTLVSSTKPVSYKPTRKWFATALAGVVALGYQAIDAGFNEDFQKGVLALILLLGTAYLVPNDPANPASGPGA